MKLNKINNIFWDFDGVIMNSNKIRDKGFELVLSEYPKAQVDKLMTFHQNNGGLSRYVKFRYFFEKIRGEKITEIEIKDYANKFSKIMMKSLTNSNLLINETFNFIKLNFKNYNMYIVSGSDQNELRKICDTLELTQYFISIYGSPINKNDLVKGILKKEKYNKKDCVLIGDSVNDYDAAKINGIKFMGYGNEILISKSDVKIF